MTKTLQDATIIVVEDDPNAQLVAIDLLRMGGCNQCYARKSVDDALRLAERMPGVDMFLVDINMPVKSGFDILTAVRNHPTLSAAQVVAMTAATLEEDVEKAKAAGFDGFMSKPLKAISFASQINQILSGEKVWDWR